MWQSMAIWGLFGFPTYRWTSATDSLVVRLGPEEVVEGDDEPVARPACPTSRAEERGSRARKTVVNGWMVFLLPLPFQLSLSLTFWFPNFSKNKNKIFWFPKTYKPPSMASTIYLFEHKVRDNDVNALSLRRIFRLYRVH